MEVCCSKMKNEKSRVRVLSKVSNRRSVKFCAAVENESVDMSVLQHL